MDMLVYVYLHCVYRKMLQTVFSLPSPPLAIKTVFFKREAFSNVRKLKKNVQNFGAYFTARCTLYELGNQSSVKLRKNEQTKSDRLSLAPLVFPIFQIEN